MNTENNGGAGQQPNPDGAAGGEGGAAVVDQPAGGQGGGEGGDTNKEAGAAGEQGVKDGASDGGEGKGGKEGGGADPTGAPEAYADFTMPEGFTLDGDRKTAAVELFRDLNLSQEQAQRAVDHFIKTIGEDEGARAAAVEAAVAKQRDEWSQQLKTQWGPDYDKELGHARSAVAAINDPALLEAFEQHGWGDHPALCKAFATFGKLLRDSPITGIGGGDGQATKQRAEQVMWPGMK